MSSTNTILRGRHAVDETAELRLPVYRPRHAAPDPDDTVVLHAEQVGGRS